VNILKKKFLEYIEIKEKKGLSDYEKYQDDNNIKFLVNHYIEELYNLKNLFIKINFDIVDAFNKLQKEDYLEIATSAITHAYLPLLNMTNQESCRLKWCY